MDDSRQNFEDYCKLWDKACEDGVFAGVEAPPPTHTSYLGLGTSGPNPDHADLYPEEDVFLDEKLIQERAGDPYFDYLKVLLAEGKSANPIYPDSVGKDQDAPKPAWVDEKVFEEVEKLKKQLYDLEVKLNTEEAGGKKWVEKCHHPETKKVWTQIESMRKRIDTLSNNLGLKDEPSQSTWKTK